MEIFTAEQLSFYYPNGAEKVLDNINLSVHEGDFIILCGPSGSGKSTLLRLFKKELNLHGKRSGILKYHGVPLEEQDPLTLSKEIGFVFQDPDNQIVMNTVKEELLFGMENFGYSTNEMRKKLAEIVHFFGLNHLLHRDTTELSGGEKQLINLASVLLMEPKILLLDEPTSQLDPIAAKEFIHLLKQVNDEFGMTIIIVEHRFDELFSIANRVMMLDAGRKVFEAEPRRAVQLMNHEYLLYLPEATQLYFNFSNASTSVPLNVKEARQWLNGQEFAIDKAETADYTSTKPLMELEEIDFQYTKDTKPVLHNLSLTVEQGETLAILGENGSGKSTLLKIIAGLHKHQHGKIKFQGKRMKRMNPERIGYLPQQPKYFFLHETLKEEYDALAEKHQRSQEEVLTLVEEFQLKHLLERHPHDLSGGELQKAALVGILMKRPELLLLDEPTKGMDPEFKEEFARILESTQQLGVTIVMVTHDIEFAAKYATRCGMMFEGDIVVTEETRKFFIENNYYTTMVRRITKDSHVPTVVTVEEAKERWRMKKELRSSV